MMLTLLILFFLSTYGLAYLIADAKIFGCPVQSYLEDPDDYEYIDTAGIIRIRQVLLRSGLLWGIPARWAKELMRCYFCMGVWCGATVHLCFVFLAQENTKIRDSYLLTSRSTAGFWICCGIAACAGSTSCYIIDLIIQKLEKSLSAQGS